MERLTALTRGMQLMLAGGILLLLVSFFRWWEVDLGVVSVGQNAWQGWGLIMGLALLALLAWLGLRLAGIALSLPLSDTAIAALLAAIVFVCAVIENLSSDDSTFWSYIGVILAAVVAVGAYLEVQAAGGMDTLRAEASSLRTSSSETTETATRPPPSAEPTAPTPPDAPPRTTPPPTETP